ncbi:MAG: VWA-like domain-containing protein [Pseudomonadota bacterium]
MSQLDQSQLPTAAADDAAHTEADDAPRLNRQTEWQPVLQRLRSHIIQADEHGLPRYGVLSILARRVPFHLYDHPALLELCDTAFTDGIHVFVSTRFLADINAADGAEQADSMCLILLHELSHILYRHHTRLPPHAPPLLWSIACDIAINSRLLRAYPQLRPGGVFDQAWGTRRDEIDAYLGHSEEHILHGLWETPPAEDAAFIAQLKTALKQAQKPPAPQIDLRGAPQDIHHHMVHPAELARTLDDSGLTHVRAALDMPDPNDKPAFANLESVSALYLSGDLDKAKEIRDEHPAGRTMAGEHLEEAWGEWVDFETYGRLEWKNLLRDLVVGEGMRYAHCDEVPSDIYFIEPQQMGLDSALFVGAQAPAAPSGVVVCIIDTSRSVSGELLKIFLEELNHLVEHECISSQQIYIVSADTTLRADILAFNDHELAGQPDRLCLFGRGGTDITRVINEVLGWVDEQPEFVPDDLQALVYFTDLLDRAPQREELPARLPKLLFLAPPSHAVKHFTSAVEAFATVAEIAPGTLIDL